MVVKLRQHEEFEKFMDSIHLTDVRFRDDLKVYFFSSYDHYEKLVPSYVRRNITFLTDSIYVTLSHATDPLKNPTGFGLALGSFMGLLEKAQDPAVCKILISNETSYNFFVKIVNLFRKVHSFDMELIKEPMKDMAISMLETEELEKFNEIVESL